MNDERTHVSSAHSLSPGAWLSLGLWMLIPVLYPIYLFDPGLPQVSSAVVILAILVALAAGFRVPVGSYPFVKYLGWFLWYVCVVNITWAVLSDSFRMLIPPFFYLFNGMVFILGLCLYERAGIRFLRVTQHAFAFSVLAQLVLLLILGPSTGRETIFFANPNQLGYFALVSAAVVLTLADRLGTPTWYRGATLGMCLFLVMVSTSFAAIGGFALLLMLALQRRPGMLVLAALGFVVLLSMWEADLFITKRIGYEKGELEGTSFMASRGYDRILNHPEHIFVGAGEGNYRLYRSSIGKHEIHSSFGTLLFCYGIIGTTLFVLFLIFLARTAGLRYAQYLVPVFLYGIAHQGLRSTMLWIFIATLYGVGRFSDEPTTRLIRKHRRVHAISSSRRTAQSAEYSI